MKEVKPAEYTCLGCKHCFPAAAINILTEEFPSLIRPFSSGCNFVVEKAAWPPVAGEYFVPHGRDSSCSVAVSTLDRDFSG
ncbi:hypothetical protein HY745_10400 [Candidatus Desantisbacteria bacterium]|nr:hypothetical protein [Candidatus Desantisbacteria bacterium]